MVIVIKKKRTGYWLGRRLSEEHKKMIAEAGKGRKHTEETRKKISDAHKGKKLSKEHIEKMREALIGRKLSEETKIKIGNFWRGKTRIFLKEHARKCRELRLIYNKKWKGKKHTEETKNKISIAHRGMLKPWVIHPDNKGEKNPNWQGGKSFELYSREWTQNLRHFIRQRDNHMCFICGKQQEKIAHDVHHIDYNKKNNLPINLITLCHRCHVATNRKREYWNNYFQIKL